MNGAELEEEARISASYREVDFVLIVTMGSMFATFKSHSYSVTIDEKAM